MNDLQIIDQGLAEACGCTALTEQWSSHKATDRDGFYNNIDGFDISVWVFPIGSDIDTAFAIMKAIYIDGMIKVNFPDVINSDSATQRLVVFSGNLDDPKLIDDLSVAARGAFHDVTA